MLTSIQPHHNARCVLVFARIDAHAPQRGIGIEMSEVRASSPAPVAVGGSETILLVDDDEMLRAAFSRMLARAGYDVVTAAGATQALGIVATLDRPVHLLVTDLLMFPTDGIELAARVRAIRPEMRVLLISGYGEESVPVTSARLAFIQKPIDRDALTRKVREVLDAPALASAPI